MRSLVKGAEIIPFREIRKRLGHDNRVLNMLKIDCEGCEWTAYKTLFEGYHKNRALLPRQIFIELHSGTAIKEKDESGLSKAESFFRYMHEMGYVIFHKEPNTMGCKGSCIEYSFLLLDQ